MARILITAKNLTGLVNKSYYDSNVNLERFFETTDHLEVGLEGISNINPTIEYLYLNLGAGKRIQDINYQIELSGSTYFNNLDKYNFQLMDPKDFLKNSKAGAVHLIGIFNKKTFMIWHTSILSSILATNGAVVLHFILDSDGKEILSLWNEFLDIYKETLVHVNNFVFLGSISGSDYACDTNKNWNRTTQYMEAIIDRDISGDGGAGLKNYLIKRYNINLNFVIKYFREALGYKNLDPNKPMPVDLEHFVKFRPEEEAGRIEKGALQGDITLVLEKALENWYNNKFKDKEIPPTHLYYIPLNQETPMPTRLVKGQAVWILESDQNKLSQITDLLADIGYYFTASWQILTNNKYDTTLAQDSHSNPKADRIYHPIFKFNQLDTTLLNFMSRHKARVLQVNHNTPQNLITEVLGGYSKTRLIGQDWVDYSQNNNKLYLMDYLNLNSDGYEVVLCDVDTLDMTSVLRLKQLKHKVYLLGNTNQQNIDIDGIKSDSPFLFSLTGSKLPPKLDIWDILKWILKN